MYFSSRLGDIYSYLYTMQDDRKAFIDMKSINMSILLWKVDIFWLNSVIDSKGAHESQKKNTRTISKKQYGQF